MSEPIERFNAEGLDGLNHHDVVALISRLASAEAERDAAKQAVIDVGHEFSMQLTMLRSDYKVSESRLARAEAERDALKVALKNARGHFRGIGSLAYETQIIMTCEAQVRDIDRALAADEGERA